MSLNKLIRFYIVVPLLFFSTNLICQVDSTYIQSFEEAFSAKTYIVDKSVSFEKGNERGSNREFTYETNKPISIGIGGSWKNFSISFGYGFDIFRDKKKGKTNSIEFQHHWYGRKLMYDFFLQQHNGFYNSKKNENKEYVLYPDVKMNMYGGTLQYVFNNKKFSYNAAMNQSEKQLKSAGSPLMGISIYYSKVKTDSTVLFNGMAKNHENLQFGVSGGYAYTWVVKKNWFVTGAASVGLNMGNNDPRHFFNEKMKFYPTVNGRFAFGYNAKTWSIGGHALVNKVYLFFDKDENLSMNNLNFQLTFIKRFDWNNIFVNNILNKTSDAVSKTKGKLGM